MSRDEKRTSPWVYVAIGCSIPVLLILILAGGALFFGYRFARQFERSMKDPASRAERAREMLGCERIPEGYHALMTMSVPLVFDLAILSDRDIDPRERRQKPFDKRGFIYVRAPQGRDGKKLKDYVEGRADAQELLDGGNIRLGDLEEIGRGRFAIEPMDVHWVANRGSLSVQRESVSGLITIMFLECPGDWRSRIGIWFGPDPSSGGTVPHDLSGTPAGEQDLRRFMSQFSPCRSSS